MFWRMKRCFPLVLAFTFFCSFLVTEANAADTNLHSLWQLQGKSNVVYLLGSVHVLKESDYPLAGPIEAAFTNSQVAVFEASPKEMKEPETQLKMMAKSTLPAGETLKDRLSPKLYADFQKQVEQAGVPATVFDQFQPAMAGFALVMIELQKLGADPANGMDEHFFSRAEKEGKRIVPLETVEFQINLMTTFTRSEEESLLRSLLDQLDDTKKMWNEMITAWKTGDSASLEKLLNDSMKESPAIFKRLVTDRNQTWVPKIEELLRGADNAVVIVGAGHLVGTNGVVELLRRKGISIKQL